MQAPILLGSLLELPLSLTMKTNPLVVGQIDIGMLK